VFGRQVEFEHTHGKRDIPDDDVRKGYIDVLEKAYRETRERKNKASGAKAVNAVGYGSPVVCLRGGVVVGKYGWWEIP